MSYEVWTVIKCDHCGTTAESHPDDGPPVDWYLLAGITGRDGCWDDKHEWHLCSARCVAEVTV